MLLASLGDHLKLQSAWKHQLYSGCLCAQQHMTAAGFAPSGSSGGSGYRFSEDQAQRIFEELFGSGFGGLGGGMGGGSGPRVRVFNSGPGGGGSGRQPATSQHCCGLQFALKVNSLGNLRS